MVGRRDFGRRLAAAAAGVALAHGDEGAGVPVALVRGAERTDALRRALELAERPDLQGREVYIKANFGSAHRSPATTHPDALAAVVEYLRGLKCGPIRLVERSGMGETNEVLESLGISRKARELKIGVLPLDTLPPESWARFDPPNSHWKQGFHVPRAIREDAALVMLCCLKTHRFGGQFSISLKNSLGLVAKRSPSDPGENVMLELHASPHQRLMIAEVNAAFTPALVVLDAAEAFVDGGPETGEVAAPGIAAVSRDRIAVDALGVVLLRIHGAGPPLDRTPVFELDQIRRAVELRLGCRSGDEIRFVTGDPRSTATVKQVSAVLAASAGEDSGKP
jgi:uncharacterized protein (DUF362 family)